MARKRRGRPVHGWLILDKPAGVTSAHAVARAKRTLDAEKAGHAGTLDPAATGLLALAFGEATKTVPFIADARKVYQFTVRWGVSTATDDAEGAPLATSDLRPERAAIEAAGADLIAACHWRHPVGDAPQSGDAVHAAIARRARTRLSRYLDEDVVIEVFALRETPSVAEAEGLTS